MPVTPPGLGRMGKAAQVTSAGKGPFSQEAIMSSFQEIFGARKSLHSAPGIVFVNQRRICEEFYERNELVSIMSVECEN